MTELNYKGLKDRHLNIFCGYDVEHLENNITKALINTFDSFNSNTQKAFCEFFLKKKLPDSEIHTFLFLQKQPDEAIVKAVPIQNRFIGYLKIDSIQLACSADKVIRKELLLNPCKAIMQNVFKTDVDERSSTTIRKHLDKSFFLREINLCFNRCNEEDGYIYLSLAMGSTMSSARRMYGEIDPPTHFYNEHIQRPCSMRSRRKRHCGMTGGSWTASIACPMKTISSTMSS